MRALLILFLVSTPVYAGEVSLISGKGVAHNPNTDGLVITVRFDESQLGPFKTYTEIGAASVSAASVEGALWSSGHAHQAFTAGKQIEYSKGGFFANVSLAAALIQRTSDGPKGAFALAPQIGMFVGYRRNGWSAGFGQWLVHRPNIEDRWTGYRWNSPQFTGFRIGLDLDIKRSSAP